MYITNIIKQFEVNGNEYLHIMDDNDNIHLINEMHIENFENNIIITFNCHCTVFRPGNKPSKLGKFNIKDNYWYFQPETNSSPKIKGPSFDEVEGLLEFEVELSKRFLEYRL